MFNRSECMSTQTMIGQLNRFARGENILTKLSTELLKYIAVPVVYTIEASLVLTELPVAMVNMCCDHNRS